MPQIRVYQRVALMTDQCSNSISSTDEVPLNRASTVSSMNLLSFICARMAVPLFNHGLPRQPYNTAPLRSPVTQLPEHNDEVLMNALSLHEKGTIFATTRMSSVAGHTMAKIPPHVSRNPQGKHQHAGQGNSTTMYM